MRRAFFVQANQSRAERAAAQSKRRPRAEAGAARTCTREGSVMPFRPGGGEHPQPARTRSTTLTGSVRRGLAVTERGREDSEDRSDWSKAEGTCPWRKRGGGNPTSPTTCKLMVGGMAEGGRSGEPTDLSPPRLCRVGDGEHGSMPPVHFGGFPVAVAGCVGCVARSDDRTGEAVSRNRGFRGRVPRRKGRPHEVRPGGNTFPTPEIVPLVGQNGIDERKEIPAAYVLETTIPVLYRR